MGSLRAPDHPPHAGKLFHGDALGLRDPLIVHAAASVEQEAELVSYRFLVMITLFFSRVRQGLFFIVACPTGFLSLSPFHSVCAVPCQIVPPLSPAAGCSSTWRRERSVASPTGVSFYSSLITHHVLLGFLIYLIYWNSYFLLHIAYYVLLFTCLDCLCYMLLHVTASSEGRGSAPDELGDECRHPPPTPLSD